MFLVVLPAQSNLLEAIHTSHKTLLNQSPITHYIFDYLCIHNMWKVIVPLDGHQDIRLEYHVPFMGQCGVKFPIEHLIEDVNLIPDLLLLEKCTINLGDGIFLGHQFDSDSYHSIWKEKMNSTFNSVQEEIDNSRTDWPEPLHLEDEGVCFQFIPFHSNRIHCHFPIKKPFPVPCLMNSPLLVTQRHKVTPIRHKMIASTHQLPEFAEYECIHSLHFMILLPSIHIKVHHHNPAPLIQWGLVGYKLYIVWPSNQANINAWYGENATEINHTFDWAVKNLQNMNVAILGPGQCLYLQVL